MAINHKKKLSVIIIIIILLLAILGGLIYFGTKKDLSLSTDSSTKTINAEVEESPRQSLAELISDNKAISRFESLLKNNALFVSLDSSEVYTVFAVNNDGIDDLDATKKEIFKAETGSDAQKNILNYHIVKGLYSPENLTEGLKLKTVEDSEFVIKNRDGDIYLIDMKGGESHVVKAGISAKNGSLYIIDSLLLPQ